MIYFFHHKSIIEHCTDVNYFRTPLKGTVTELFYAPIHRLKQLELSNIQPYELVVILLCVYIASINLHRITIAVQKSRIMVWCRMQGLTDVCLKGICSVVS